MLRVKDKIVLTDERPQSGQILDTNGQYGLENGGQYLSDISGPVDFGMAKTLYRWSDIYNLQVDYKLSFFIL